jgi:hypothetical protein
MAKMNHCCEPGSAMPVSEALINTQVSAEGPMDKRKVPLHITPTTAGNKAAYKPVTKGMPAKAA